MELKLTRTLYTGCRTCKIRKVKCDEEKVVQDGSKEPQCRRCIVARIRCDWKSGPIPRRTPKTIRPKLPKPDIEGQNGVSLATKDSRPPLLPMPPLSLPVPIEPEEFLQASNSLTLSTFDRSCLEYLQDSVLVVMLGKHWPWSTLSYTYRRVAVKEPMVMSMILATTASEIHRSRVFDCDNAPGNLPVDSLSDVAGRTHYGKALSSLRETLKHDVKSPEKLEAVFITLWLMIDYENRFGNGSAGINVHMHGIISLLFNHVLPSVKYTEDMQITFPKYGGAIDWPTPTHNLDFGQVQLAHGKFDEGIRSTTVPLFLLWILYFCTPGALFCRSGAVRSDAKLFRLFLRSGPETSSLSLPELYKISRQSPSRFWGEEYPASAQLDDLENLPGLTLYHKSHVIQFKITELFSQNFGNGEISKVWEASPYKNLINELVTISEVSVAAKRFQPSCQCRSRFTDCTPRVYHVV